MEEKSIEIRKELFQLLRNQGADFISVVDISEQIRPLDLPAAIIIGAALPKQYLHNLYVGKEEMHNEFVNTERRTDALAELAEKYLIEQGYGAFAQSEKRNTQMGFYDDEKKKTILPHKTIAVLGGIGWIGKSDLLVTPQYGSGISMCTVLTDAPFMTANKMPMTSQCGKCSICTKICPEKIIHNHSWEPGISREEIISVNGCGCCLKCMTHCPWTRKFAKKNRNMVIIQ